MDYDEEPGMMTLTLDAMIREVEYQWQSEGVLVFAEMAAYVRRAIRAEVYVYIPYDEENFSYLVRECIEEELHARFAIGSWHRLTADSFDFREDKLVISEPAMVRLDFFVGAQVEYLLKARPHDLRLRTLISSPARLLPEMLLPILRNLEGFAGRELLTKYRNHDLLVADGREWRSVRIEFDKGSLENILSRALEMLAAMTPANKRFIEVLVHISAPNCEDLVCLVGITERIRAIVGEETPVMMSTSVSKDAVSTVGLLAR